MTIKIIIQDEVNVKLEGLSPDLRRNLHKDFKIKLPYAYHLPAVKMGHWDGTHAFFQLNGTSYYNMLEEILDRLINVYNITDEIEIEDNRKAHDFDFEPIDENYLSEYVWPKGHNLEGQPIVLQDYQVHGVNTFLENRIGVLSYPTASGKTLVMASMCKSVEKYGGTLTVVPNLDLIAQSLQTYKLVGLDAGEYSGNLKDLDHKHIILTWQAVYYLYDNYTKDSNAETIKKIINNKICLINDETQNLKFNQQLNLIKNVWQHIPLRVGLSGTIPKDDISKRALHVGIGPLIGKLKTKTLQDRGLIATCNVSILQFQDHVKFVDYVTENQWLTTDLTRLKKVVEIIESKTGNTLILVTRIETGELLEKLIPGSKFIHGADSTKERKEQYDLIDKIGEDTTLICTFGIASTGISINRINNLFMFEVGKSFVKTIQSIGRALRMAKPDETGLGAKTHAEIFDICSSAKYSARHLTERKKYYKEAEYPFKITKVVYK